jgi:DNA-binding Lrp family transcriptional regulator
MKAWLILGGMALVAALLVWWLASDHEEDVHRLFEKATIERPVIEKSLAECGDLVRYFADRKPTEKKKGELDDLRRRFEAMEHAARDADADVRLDRIARKKRLAEIEEGYYKLRVDATDLLARLREMKKYDELLKPLIAKLGRLKKTLIDATTQSSDPEFLQRAAALLEESKSDQSLADTALVKLSTKILDGRVMAQAAVNEITDVCKRIDELLSRHAGSPARAGN